MKKQLTISLEEYEGLKQTIIDQQKTIDEITSGKKPIYLSDRPFYFCRYLSVNESKVVNELQEELRKKEDIIAFLKAHKPDIFNFSRETIGETLSFEINQRFRIH